MSSHSEAPEISKDPSPTEDLYAFISPTAHKVTLIATTSASQPAASEFLRVRRRRALRDPRGNNVTVTPTYLPVRFETKLTTPARTTRSVQHGQITSLKDATWNRKHSTR